MLAVFSLFLSCLFTHILDCFGFTKITKIKFKLSFINCFLILLAATMDFFIRNIDPFLIRILLTNLVTFVLLRLIYKKSVCKTFVITLILNIITAIAEILCLLFVFVFLPKNTNLESTEIQFVLSMVIYAFYIILCMNRLICNLFNSIVEWCDDKKVLKIASYCILSTMICAILLSIIYYKNVESKYMLIIFAIVTAILLFIVGYFKEKSDNNRLSIKFSQLLDYVKDYEDEVIEKSKVQHEYKNQLGVISGMIPDDPKLKELKDYVSKKLSKAEKIDNSVWLEKITNLPSGGIKGIVYLKIKKMLDNDIIVHIEIDNKLKSKNKWLAINNNLEDYTRIIGVYLDNAIDAASQAKEKQIIIEFIDNKDNIEFDISNTYIGDIEFDKIDNEKYSTKGDSRGYGLSIVKDIMDNNKLISQERELNGKFFVEKLYIKKQD